MNALMLAATLLCLQFTTKAQTQWDIDILHSYIGFDIMYMEIIPFHGKFEQIEGTIQVDPKNYSNLKIDVKIPVHSIKTGSQKRESHLKSSDFFHAKKHPFISFKSQQVITVGKGPQLKIVGSLKIRGISKTIELIGNFTSKPITDPWQQTKIGASFEGEIDRQDFGITYNETLESGALAIDNKVTLVLDIVLIKRT